MFSMLKKIARFFGKGIGYSAIFCVSPFILVGMCCSDRNGHGIGNSMLKCLGCIFIPFAILLAGITLPLGVAGMAISLAGLIAICPLAAVGDCLAAAFRTCTANSRAAPAHPAYDIENPPHSHQYAQNQHQAMQTYCKTWNEPQNWMHFQNILKIMSRVLPAKNPIA